MEALGRVELPTNGLGNRCSIHLSYRAAYVTGRTALVYRSRRGGSSRFAAQTVLSQQIGVSHPKRSLPQHPTQRVP